VIHVQLEAARAVIGRDPERGMPPASQNMQCASLIRTGSSSSVSGEAAVST
jgi:hypothetical protein